MFKKTTVFIFSVILLLNICGCAALIVGGAAGGAGTAVWLSGKLTQYVDVSFEQATKAAKDYLQSQRASLTTKETISSGYSLVQVRSRNANGERVRIDIYKINESRSRLEVRVGTVISNRSAAEIILKGITERL